MKILYTIILLIGGTFLFLPQAYSQFSRFVGEKTLNNFSKYMDTQEWTPGHKEKEIIFFLPSEGCPSCSDFVLNYYRELRQSETKVNLILYATSSGSYSQKKKRLSGLPYLEDLDYLAEDFNLDKPFPFVFFYSKGKYSSVEYLKGEKEFKVKRKVKRFLKS